MKTIILLAKKLAQENGAKYMELEHLRNALDGVVFTDDNIENFFVENLKLKNPAHKIQIADENQLSELADSEISQIMPYSDDVKTIFQTLTKKHSITKKSIVSRLYIDKKTNSEKLLSLNKIKENLEKKIFDQDIAIEAVKDTVSQALFSTKPNSVRASLFFLGPPATGKTYLSELFGEVLKEYGYKIKIFNMTMYSDESSALIGLSSPYKGARKGDLTEFIEKNPKSIIVFDEIEKCHPIQQKNLFRLLDRGVVEDKYSNSIIDAKDTILIFTSNLGKEIYSRDNYSDLIKEQKETESLMIDVISRETNEFDSYVKAITPPLLSRLSGAKIVLFNKIGVLAYYRIAKKEIERYFKEIEIDFGVKCKIDELATLAFLCSYLPTFDPRRIKNKIGDDVFDYLRDYVQSKSILLNDIDCVDFSVDDSSKEFFKANLFNKDSYNDRRFQELSEKRERIGFNVNITESGKSLKVEVTDPKIEKVKNISDFHGDSKLSLDIPGGKLDGEPNANIFGHDEAKKMLVRISNKIQRFQKLRLENSKKALDVIKNIPKGILLYGPPGTGKTKIARAFAAQVEMPIMVTSGASLVDIITKGSGTRKIKEIFKKARDNAPCILFIDEIDAVGKRGDNQHGSNNNEEINTLLEEIDGFDNDHYKPVFVIAATNRKDKIDEALIRSGRLEEHIKIGHLDKNARKDFLDFMFKNDDDFSNTIETDKFIKYTVGMSGAELERVFKKAKYEIDIKRESTNDFEIRIDIDLLIETINEIRYGKRVDTLKNAKKELLLTAYHEAGHAIVSLALSPHLPIEQITVVPRADFAGFVSYNSEEIRRWDKSLLISKVASAYAGRISEEVYFEKQNKDRGNGISHGAVSDIETASNLIKDAIYKLGMDKEVGLLNIDVFERLSESKIASIDDRTKLWHDEIYKLSESVIKRNWDNIKRLAQELVGDDTYEGKETVDAEWIEKNIHIHREESWKDNIWAIGSKIKK